MSGNGNGKWTMWVLGIIIVTCLPYIGNAVIQNDKDSRSRDERLNEKIAIACEKQGDMNSQMLLALKEIQTDLKYIRHESAR